MKLTRALRRAVSLSVWCWAGAVHAQFYVPNFVTSAGAQVAENFEFQIVGTVGQALVGIASNVGYLHFGGFWNVPVSVVTAVEPVSEAIPKRFELRQNYPNPFNPSTTIQFAVPRKSKVTLKLFDLLGREVVTLLEEEMGPGEYKIYFEARDLPSGTYFYRMKAGDFSASRKLVLVR